VFQDESTLKARLKEFGMITNVTNKSIPERIVKTVSEAQIAIKPLIGKPITNKVFGITATISGKTIGKLGSDVATKQSVNPRLHALAVANIDKLFENAELHTTEADRKERSDINQFHKFGILLYDNETKQYYPVKITAKEYINPIDGTRIYSVEAVDIEKQKSAGLLESSPEGIQSPFADFYTKLANLAENANKDEARFMAFGKRKAFGGNSGYVGYSMSKRAEQAYQDGKLTYSKLPVWAKRLVDAAMVSTDEWHHTSSYGNKTPFYSISQFDILSDAEKQQLDVHDWDSIEDFNIVPKSVVKAFDVKSKEELKKKNDTKRVRQTRIDKALKELNDFKSQFKRFNRQSETPEYGYVEISEMNGKYGWFDSSKGSYKLPEYHSGIDYETAENKDKARELENALNDAKYRSFYELELREIGLTNEQISELHKTGLITGEIMPDSFYEIIRKNKDLIIEQLDELKNLPKYNDKFNPSLNRSKESFLTEKEKQERQNRHSAISENIGNIYGDNYERRYEHQRVDDEYRKISEERHTEAEKEYINSDKVKQDEIKFNNDKNKATSIRQNIEQLLNDNNITDTDKIQFLRTKDGTIYGAKFPDGSIYISPDNLNANTPIHEFGHIWEQAFGARFRAGVEILKQSAKGRALIEQVRNNPFYKNMTQEQIEREALVVAIGNKGEQLFGASNYEKLKQWISDLFKAIKEKLGIKQNLTADETLENFTKGVVGELLGGKVLNEDIGKSIKEQDNHTALMAEYATESDFERNRDGSIKKDETGAPILTEKAKKEIAEEYDEIEKRYDGKAPNGKTSKLTKEQWIQVRTSRFKNWFGDWEGDAKNKVSRDKIEKLLKSDRDTSKGIQRETIGKVTTEQAKILKDTLGIDVSGYEHTIDKGEINHTINEHGNEKTEAQRGQIAVTENDFSLIPEILNTPDKIEYIGKNKIGRDVIKYTKRFNGKTLLFEAVLTGKKELQFSSMYKQKSVGEKLHNTTARTSETLPQYKDKQNLGNTVSKVIDENGEPLVVHHGTNREFNNFYDSENGIYFSDKKRVAEEYTYHIGLANIKSKTPNIIPVFLNIRNPKEIDALGKKYNNIPVPYQQWERVVYGRLPKNAQSVESVFLYYNEKGYDGVIVKDVIDSIWKDSTDKSKVIVAQNPNQIKSATSNTGSFSNETNDIRFKFDSTTIKDDVREMKAAGTKPNIKTISKKAFDGLINRLKKAFPNVKVFQDESTLKAKLKEFGMDMTDFMASYKKLASQYDFLFNGKSVANLTGKEFEAKEGVTLKQQVNHFFNSIGNITQSVFGEVVLDNRVYKDDSAHGQGREKIATYNALPAILENGMDILPMAEHKKGVRSGMVGAPITIDGKEYIAVAVVREINDNSGRKRLYVHEVTLKEKLLESSSNPVGNKANTTATNQGEIAKVLNNIVLAKKNPLNFLSVWHGSPYNFDKFSTDKIGTGEGAQVFGWGLYFTDLESIARGHVNKLYDKSKLEDINKRLSEISKELEKYQAGEYGKYNSPIGYELKKEYDELINSRQEEIRKGKTIYKVSLHKNKTPDQYIWLDWDKPLSREQVSKLTTALKGEIVTPHGKTSIRVNIGGGDFKLIDTRKGAETYNQLSRLLGSDKATSEFLLKNGIDGVKYPVESISRGATSDNTRGFNYVVFDENAVEIEDKIQFLRTKDGTIYGAKFPDGSIYISPDNLNANTPIHEFGHIWEQAFGARFKAGVEILKQSAKGRALIEQVRNNPFYKNMTQEQIEREALVVAIGNKGEQLFGASNYEKLKQWISDLFNAIKEKLGFKQNLTADETLENFTKGVVGELLGGKVLNEDIGKNVLNLLNDKNEINYGELTKQTDRILNRTSYIDRLSLEEEQGRRRGGRTAVEATLLIRADTQAGRGRQEDNIRSEVISNQEKILSDYADKNNLWVDENKVAIEAAEQLPSGYESNVYVSADGKTVTKFVSYRILDNTPQSFLDNRIALNNFILNGSNTEYTLKGFARNSETGQFQFVVEQPYVQGKLVDFNNKEQKEAFDEEMQKRGFQELAYGVYTNKDYVLYDVKNGNVKITPEGNYRFIDIATTLNDRKTNGNREYGDGGVITTGVQFDTSDKKTGVDFKFDSTTIKDDVREMKAAGLSEDRIREVLSLSGNTQEEIDKALSGEGEVFGIKKAMAGEEFIQSHPLSKMSDKEVYEASIITEAKRRTERLYKSGNSIDKCGRVYAF
jgi:hypothetical protein